MQEPQTDLFRKARKDWISATHFEDFDETGVLLRVAARAKEILAEGGDPWVVFDLDSTLYNVQPRTEAIFREWLALEETRTAWPKAQAALSLLEPDHVGYSLQDTWFALGVDPTTAENQEAWRSARGYWARHFFSAEYLKHDQPYPGGREFVLHLADTGVGIAFLTARDHATLREATLRQLKRDGFPIGIPRTSLHLKPTDESHADFEFKPAAVREILESNGGRLVASFENEPVNLAAIQAVFPEAMHVFMETHCSDRPAPVCSRLYRIRKFG